MPPRISTFKPSETRTLRRSSAVAEFTSHPVPADAWMDHPTLAPLHPVRRPAGTFVHAARTRLVLGAPHPLLPQQFAAELTQLWSMATPSHHKEKCVLSSDGSVPSQANKACACTGE